MTPTHTVTDTDAERVLLLTGERSGFYAARTGKASVAERLWPWVLVAVSILATFAAMAR